MLMKNSFLFLFLPYALAFELPFSVSRFFSSRSAVHTSSSSASTTPRIAIIGAGAGGSSAAFWISKGKERFGLDVQVDVYESSDYIGGRSTVVYPYNNKSLPELELGASIFVQPNRNLWRASDEFNLTRKDFHEEDYETGIWDGQELFLSFSGGWWDTAKLLWRYGILSPKRTEDIVRHMVKGILDLYQSMCPKWDNISSLVKSLGWTREVNSTTAENFKEKGVSDRYIFEVIQAATRVNYGQNSDQIHAVGGAVSMAASGARGIVGGNYKIFEQFLNRSGANVFLNTRVKSVTPTSSGWTLTSTRGTTQYKAVILAAPFHSTKIVVPISISEQIPEQPYVRLHVTLLSTTAPYPNPQYFGFPAGTKVPKVILTTKERSNGSAKPEFNSLSYHGLIEGEWAVKFFSDHRLSDEWLDNMFGGKVKWVFRKEWDAYPKLFPTTTFPPVRLDHGFYYVNSFEPLISTMETETVSSRNVVDLLLHDEFNAGICKPDTTENDGAQQPLLVNATPSKVSEDFVLGFDC